MKSRLQRPPRQRRSLVVKAMGVVEKEVTRYRAMSSQIRDWCPDIRDFGL